MKVSFDGLRRKIAEDFNDLIEAITNSSEISYRAEDEIKPCLTSLRSSLGALMACYDSKEEDDFNDLSEEIKLLKL